MQKIIRKIKELLKESREWIKIALFIFLIAIFLGIVSFFWRSSPIYPIIFGSISKISDLGKEAKQADFLGRFIIIYRNNIISMTSVLFGGIIFGIFTAIGLFVNGLLLGFFSMLVIFTNQSILTRIILLLLLAPHGIIELSLLIIVCGWGLKLGLEFLFPQAKGKRFRIFLYNLKNSFWMLLFLLAGLAVAAFIEVIDMKILEFLVR